MLNLKVCAASMLRWHIAVWHGWLQVIQLVQAVPMNSIKDLGLQLNKPSLPQQTTADEGCSHSTDTLTALLAAHLQDMRASQVGPFPCQNSAQATLPCSSCITLHLHPALATHMSGKDDDVSASCLPPVLCTCSITMPVLTQLNPLCRTTRRHRC